MIWAPSPDEQSAWSSMCWQEPGLPLCRACVSMCLHGNTMLGDAAATLARWPRRAGCSPLYTQHRQVPISHFPEISSLGASTCCSELGVPLL